MLLLKHIVTNASYLFKSKYIGIPTMLLRPINATCFPCRALVLPRISCKILITPSGVHETKYGVWRLSARLPILKGCSPSTSFSGPIKFTTSSWFKWGGSGNYTRTPFIFGSAWSCFTVLRRCSSEVSDGSVNP